MINLDIGVTVYIDTTIGFRYEVAFVKGTRVLSHVALFYRFLNPNQSVLYDFRTHQSTLNNSGGVSPGYDTKVYVVGNDGVNGTLVNASRAGFACTHLRQTVDKAVSDYWMSPRVPGFSKIVNTLKPINTRLPALAFAMT